MASYRIFGLVMCCILIPLFSFSQNNQKDLLDEQFSSYEIISINSTSLLKQINFARSAKVHLKVAGWEMDLTDSGIIDSRYKAVEFDGVRQKEIQALPAKAMQGFTVDGSRVSLTINENFIQGFIKTAMYTFYIEPLYHFDKKAEKDLFVIYNTKDIKPGVEKSCGVTSAHLSSLQHPEKTTGSRVGQCYEVQYAIAADYLMFTNYGSTAAVQNHNIAVTNDMQTNYDNEFADAVQWVIVQQFIVSVSGGDPWSNATDPSVLLNSFTSWGPTGFTTTHDVASLWSKRDFDGSTIGLAWVGTVCTNNKYNVLQDFSTNASQKRVLLAHELGHNFSASHDASGSTTIMAPSVSSSTTWSAPSITAIQNHYLSRTCLASCIIGAGATISFGAASSNIAEFGSSGTTGTCNEPYKLLTIPVVLNTAIPAPATVSVTVAAGATAQNNIDFSILNSVLTFPAGQASTQQLQIRIIDDGVQELTELFTLQLAITSGAPVLGPQPTHQVQILDLDSVSASCCSPADAVTYGSYNAQAEVVFFGLYEDANTRALYLPANLTTAGITAGYITGLQFYVQVKGSTLPYNNFRIKLANVAQTTLENMAWIAAEEVYSGNYTTVLGTWNEIVFNKPFYWDGTSSIYMQFCFDNSAWTANDQIRLSAPVGGSTGRFIEVLYNDASEGCSLAPGSSNFSGINNMQPHLKFSQLKGAKVESVVNANSKSRVRSGETAHLYSANGKIIASIKNIGATDINCVDATIETSGSTKLALPFGGGDYTAKTVKIDATYAAVYEVTLYYTQTELATFGASASRLNIIKTQTTLASSTLSNSVIFRPDSIISGLGPDVAFAYKGTFSGFSRFALTNRMIDAGSIISNGDIVLDQAAAGVIFSNKTGNNYLLTVTNSGLFNIASATSTVSGANLSKSDLLVNTTGNNIILRAPNGTYRRLSINDSGVLSNATASLPTMRSQITAGHFRLNEGGGAILMKSPNGSCWRIFVNEAGQLRTAATLCP